MAAAVNVEGYYAGTVWLNWGKFGWSETIESNSASDAAALTHLLKYVRHRLWCLPATVEAVYGRIVKVPHVRYSVPLTGLPLIGKAPDLTAANVEDMDSVERSATMNFVVDNGKKSIRFFHGLPDDAITAQALTLTPAGDVWIDLVNDPGDGTATPATLTAALKNLMSYIGQKCIVPGQRQSLTIGGVVKLGYATNVITGILPRAVRNKKVGRPFGLSHGKGPIR